MSSSFALVASECPAPVSDPRLAGDARRGPAPGRGADIAPRASGCPAGHRAGWSAFGRGEDTAVASLRRVARAATTRAAACLALLSLLLLLSGCGLLRPEGDRTRDWNARQLYDGAKSALANGDYDTAIDLYEKLEARFPFGTLAQQAQIDVAYAYYKSDEPASALAAADRFIKLHPSHPSVDYAYYLKGIVNFNQGQTFMDRLIAKDRSMRDPGAAREAFEHFAELVRRFPDSKYAEDSTEKMSQLKNTLARHELNVAEYYLRRGAYLAAVNRGRYVVENFQGALATYDALAVMVRGYVGMGLHDLAAQSLRVLESNAPEYEDLPELRDLLAASTA